MTNSFATTAFVLLLLTCAGCQRESTPAKLWNSADSLRIMDEIMQHRIDADRFFRSDPESPFQKDTTSHFAGIKWFPADLKFYCRSPLHRYDHPETVQVFGTKGELRTHLRYGYFDIFLGGQSYKLNVYKSAEGRGGQYPVPLSLWFTDATTGKETYNVGRYVDIGDQNPDPEALYTIDFNKAYNPYCAYTSIYSCAIPRKEDHLDIAIRAGELKYHP